MKKGDRSPTTDYYISKEAPYYFGKESYRFDKDGNKLMSSKEVFIGFNILEYSYRNRLEEMLKESREKLSGVDLPWIKKEEKN